MIRQNNVKSAAISSPGLFLFKLLVPFWLCVLAFGFSSVSAAQEVGANGLPNDNRYSVRGLVRSANRIALRTSVDTMISTLDLKIGDTFRQGDVLYELDCTRFDAETIAAAASVDIAAIDHATKQRLLKHGAIGKGEVRMAAAQLAQKKAEHAVREAVGRQCTMVAPFDGQVVEVNAAMHEQAPRDRPLMVILDHTRLEIEMVVPSHWLAWLSRQQEFEMKVDETGTTHTARIMRIGAEVDAVSQTIPVIAHFSDQGINAEKAGGSVIRPGMSGTATFGSGS